MTTAELDQWGMPQRFREHGGHRVPAFTLPSSRYSFEEVEEAIKTYKWRDEDFLLATYPKCGTHFMWEIMMMLVRGSADYVQDTKGVAMMELFPITEADSLLPSPRVLNTHYRLDCLPDEFRGRKTVQVLRNPKDMLVSFYHHMKSLTIELKDYGSDDPVDAANQSFSQFFQQSMTMPNPMYGTYFDYMNYMWSLKDDPNMLVIYFEDLKRKPVEEIKKVNTFMGTNRSDELIAEIANSTNFDKMKKGKESSEVNLRKYMFAKPEDRSAPWSIYRKGGIGDWKNYFTVADNEAFDKMIAEWQKTVNIPLIFE